MRWPIAALPLFLFGSDAMAERLEQYRWENRPVLVFAATNDEPRLEVQLREFEHVGAEFVDRDMVLVAVIGDEVTVDGSAAPDMDSADLRESFGIDPEAFATLLVGKDGGVKLRRDEPVAANEVFALIDTMPMRRQEMRRREKQEGG